MTNTTSYRSGRHVVFNLHVHLVFVAKYRKTIFTKEAISSMKILFEKVCEDFEADLIEVDGEGDHVHLLLQYPPKVSVAKLVNSLKGVSSRRLKQLQPELLRFYSKGALWSPSYFAGSCGGAPIEVVRKYIEQQITPD